MRRRLWLWPIARSGLLQQLSVRRDPIQWMSKDDCVRAEDAFPTWRQQLASRSHPPNRNTPAPRSAALEVKKPQVRSVVQIYWADGTFVGEMRY